MKDNETEYKKLLDVAMTMLSRRELCSGELSSRLRARKFSAELVETALRDLQQRGLQSDLRCAEVLVREHVLRGHGQMRIHQDLSRRGVGDEFIEAALAASECDFRELAREVLHKRYGNEVPSDYKERVRRIAFLQRRGFAISDCQHAVTTSP